MIRETIETAVLGPYSGPRISGSSDDVMRVRLTVIYQFEEATIRFEGIPAIVDRTYGREIVSGDVAATVNRTIKAIRQTVQYYTQQPTSIIDTVRKTFTVPAGDFSQAA